MRFITRPQFSYVSPWLFAAATALLVLIVVTFTVNNIQREEYLMTKAMLEKADTLIRIVHSGARSSYFAEFKRGNWNTGPWNEYAQQVVDHVSEDPAIDFLAIVNESGKIIVHDDREQIGKEIECPLPDISHQQQQEGHAVISHRILEDKSKGRTFAAIRLFYPYFALSPSIPLSMKSKFLELHPSGHVGPAGSLVEEPSEALKEVDEGGVVKTEAGTRFFDNMTALHKNYFIMVGLNMRGFDQSLKRQKLQVIILSLAMLLVGAGGWLSLAAVQGLRVSQKTLRDMKAFTGLLVARLPVGIIATDKKGRITTFNKAASDMIGISAKKATRKKPDEVLPEEFADFFGEQEDQNSQLEKTQSREREITFTRNGYNENLLCHIDTVQDENSDKHAGQVLLISNLTELKKLEKEMRANERLAAVGRMAAGVAHEVRNPLSSIKGLALLLKNKFDQNSSESETAGLLIQEVDRMNRTVSELLSFTRPSTLNLDKISLKEMLDDNLRLISSDMQSSNVSTQLVVDDRVRCVLGDKDRLNQVFINLLLNAVQSMEEGGRLTVSARNSDESDFVLVTIQDTGCGIAQENRSQLFYPYFTTKPGGTGIGLAISQKIVNDHNGSIKVESTLGEGTTVIVKLPVYTD